MKKLMQVCMLVAGIGVFVSASHAGEVADEVKEVMETITPVAESVSDKLAQYLTAAEEVINQYGGQAVDLGLNVLRIEAAASLFPQILVFPFLFFLSWKAYQMIRQHGKDFDAETHMRRLIAKGYQKRDYYECELVGLVTGSVRTSSIEDEVEFQKGVVTYAGEIHEKCASLSEDQKIVGYIISASAFIIGSIVFTHTLKIWAWVGIFWPEAYAVHKFLM